MRTLPIPTVWKRGDRVTRLFHNDGSRDEFRNEGTVVRMLVTESGILVRVQMDGRNVVSTMPLICFSQSRAQRMESAELAAEKRREREAA